MPAKLAQPGLGPLQPILDLLLSLTSSMVHNQLAHIPIRSFTLYFWWFSLILQILIVFPLGQSLSVNDIAVLADSNDLMNECLLIWKSFEKSLFHLKQNSFCIVIVFQITDCNLHKSYQTYPGDMFDLVAWCTKHIPRVYGLALTQTTLLLADHLVSWVLVYEFFTS